MDALPVKRHPVGYLVASSAAPLAVAAAAVYVGMHGGFGQGDLRAFAVWSVILLLPLLTVLRASDPFILHRPARIRIAISFLLGAIVGLVYTFVLAFGMGPSIGAFSFPILYLWSGSGAVALCIAALVRPLPSVGSLSSPRKWGVAAAFSFVIVGVLPMLMFFGSVFIWDRAEKEVHLLPNGYEGPVVIIFNDSLGAPIQYEGKARRYEIPASGVLRTRFPPNDGWSRPNYEYVDASGNRFPIVPGTPCNDSLPTDPVQACLMGHMTIGGQPPRQYSAYIVGRRARMRALYDQGDSVVRTVVYGVDR